MENKIPKIIHLCWFGNGQFDDKMKFCMETWEKFCPEYKVMKWDEESFDLSSCLYAKQAYEKKRWAFVTDYVRFKVLELYGGIYLDTDMQLLKSLDEFLGDDAFFSFKQLVGEMKLYTLTSGIIGSKRANPLFKPLIDEFESRSYINENGEEDMKPVAAFLTDILVSHGFAQNNELQKRDGIAVYPNEYLCPTLLKGGKIVTTENTAAIHHFTGTWRTPEILDQLMEKVKNAKEGENVL